MTENTNSLSFRRYAWCVLAYIVVVILWGAYVRATGSGAGCGQHWPLCNGEILPRAERIQTMIEFSHRLSSGLALLVVFVLYFWARKIFVSGSFERKAAFASLVAIILEALIGAFLVLMRLVEHDKSIDRAVSISLHLVNTLFLLASLTLLAQQEARPRWVQWKRDRGTVLVLLGFGLLGALGALTALGDTLFPPSSLASGLAADVDTKRHFLERIRVLHPVLAVLWFGALVVWALDLAHKMPALQKQTRWLLAVTAGNLLFGLCNVIALAPVWMQIVHLLWANVIWVFLVSTAFSRVSRWQE